MCVCSKAGAVVCLLLALWLCARVQSEWVQVWGGADWVQLPTLAPPPASSARTDNGSSSNSTAEPGVVENFITVMQEAHQRLRSVLWPSPQQPNSLIDKKNYLIILRNYILNHIARTMFGINSDDKMQARRLKKRGTGWGSGDHSEIGFPSLEVALLTLAFLVFAVFLVNMVLVLFSNIFGTTSSSTSSNTQALGRRRRAAMEAERTERTARILEAIDQFHGRHRDPLEVPYCHAASAGGVACAESGLNHVARFLLGLKV